MVGTQYDTLCEELFLFTYVQIDKEFKTLVKRLDGLDFSRLNGKREDILEKVIAFQGEILTVYGECPTAYKNRALFQKSLIEKHNYLNRYYPLLQQEQPPSSQ